MLASPPFAFGQVAHWDFENSANDQSGNGFDGVLTADATFAPGLVGQAVSLDGSGDAVAFPAITAVDASEFTVSAWINSVGTHTIDLTVTDDQGAQGLDSLDVTVLPGNQGPIADAGLDQTVSDADESGAETVTLDGTGSSDPDGTIVSYDWSEGGSPLGSGAVLPVGFVVGVHTIDLTVTDDQGATGVDSVDVTVLAGNVNQDPIADAGPDQTVSDADNSGAEAVTLDGTGSSDGDGTIVSYDWSESDGSGGVNPLGSGSTLGVSLGVGVHTIDLLVTDDEGATGTDSVTVTVLANQSPTADAGPDVTVTDADESGAETVTLDGTGSSDADGTIVSYEWTEGATILGTTAVLPVSFTLGSHDVTLTVTDDGGDTNNDAVTIVVNPPTGLPAGLVGHWNFENDTDDQSGNGFDGVIHGDPGFIAGISGQALDLDGTGDAVELPEITALDASEFSVSIWVNVDPASSGRLGMFHASITAGDEIARLFVQGSRVYFANGYDALTFPPCSTTVPSGEWRMVTVTVDSAAQEAKVYIDGAECVSDTSFSTASGTFGAENFIGARFGPSSESFQGQLDEVMLWNRSLTAAEVLTVFQSL